MISKIACYGGNRMAQDEKTKLTVQIYHNTYTIVGTESESHIRLVASLVDQKMRDLSKQNKHLDTTRLAVLTAVNTMNEYIKLQQEYQALLRSLNKKEDH